MLEDFRLKVFIAVAEEGSFTKASLRLGISQPAVSQNIAELEKITGAKLFDRLPGEISLTDAGRVFLGYAKEIDASYHTVSDLFADGSPLFDRVLQVGVSDELAASVATSAATTYLATSPSRHLSITCSPKEADIFLSTALGKASDTASIPSVFFTSKRSFTKYAESGRNFTLAGSRAPLAVWDAYTPLLGLELSPYVILSSSSSYVIAETVDAASAVGILPAPLAHRVMADGRFIILQSEDPFAFSHIIAEVPNDDGHDSVSATNIDSTHGPNPDAELFLQCLSLRSR